MRLLLYKKTVAVRWQNFPGKTGRMYGFILSYTVCGFHKNRAENSMRRGFFRKTEPYLHRRRRMPQTHSAAWISGSFSRGEKA